MGGIFQPPADRRGLRLDPRTKLFLLLTMSTFVSGGAAGGITPWMAVVFAAVPMVLLLSAGRWLQAMLYLTIYLAATFANQYLGILVDGLPKYLLLGCSGIITRMLPSLMTGAYVISTTTVSEFDAAMGRLHISEKIIIPMLVMFRLFPTIGDEFSFINAAMRMRGVSFGGGKVSKMLEYRLVPLLSCTVGIGEELSTAALTRGLGGNCKRTNVCHIGLRMVDVVTLLICLVPYMLLLLSWLHVL